MRAGRLAPAGWWGRTLLKNDPHTREQATTNRKVEFQDPGVGNSTSAWETIHGTLWFLDHNKKRSRIVHKLFDIKQICSSFKVRSWSNVIRLTSVVISKVIDFNTFVFDLSY